MLKIFADDNRDCYFVANDCEEAWKYLKEYYGKQEPDFRLVLLEDKEIIKITFEDDIEYFQEDGTILFCGAGKQIVKSAQEWVKISIPGFLCGCE